MAIVTESSLKEELEALLSRPEMAQGPNTLQALIPQVAPGFCPGFFPLGDRGRPARGGEGAHPDPFPVGQSLLFPDLGGIPRIVDVTPISPD